MSLVSALVEVFSPPFPPKGYVYKIPYGYALPYFPARDTIECVSAYACPGYVPLIISSRDYYLVPYGTIR